VESCWHFTCNLPRTWELVPDSKLMGWWANDRHRSKGLKPATCLFSKFLFSKHSFHYRTNASWRTGKLISLVEIKHELLSFSLENPKVAPFYIILLNLDKIGQFDPKNAVILLYNRFRFMVKNWRLGTQWIWGITARLCARGSRKKQ